MRSVAISGDTVIVGAIDDVFFQGPGAGAAYIFSENSGVWSEVIKLVHPTGADSDGFGLSVDICGDLAVVGAFRDEVNGLIFAGSVHTFREVNPGIWLYDAMITGHPQPDMGDQFGQTVEILPGDVLAIGAPIAECNASNAGAILFYNMTAGSAWTHALTVCPPNAVFLDELAVSLDSSQSLLIAGNTGDDDIAPFAGATLIYDVAALLCTPDLNNDATIDTADLGLLLSAFGTACPCCPADINGDGAVDTADLGILLSAFGTACP